MRGLVVLPLLLAGCGGDLPAASFIDKLRVLAVQANPPELGPGASTLLRALVVEPAQGSASTISYHWLACAAPTGVLSELPCGVSPPGAPAPPQDPPRCADQPSASPCLLGDTPEVTLSPDRGVLGANPSGELLVSVTVADRGAGEACLAAIAAHSGLPQDPDHCVVALKRVTVTDPARATTPLNANPRLQLLGVRPPGDQTSEPIALTEVGATFTFSDGKNPPKRSLTVRRAEDAAELRADGRYEILSVSWFTTGGKIDGGRSSFTPSGCASQSDCPMVPPAMESTTDWEAPTSSTIDSSGAVQFWAVIRDDRGGVGWLDGSAKPTPP
jgi:hypothetical protein